MDSIRSLRLFYKCLLIVSLQLLSTRALPYAAIADGDGEIHEADCDPKKRPYPPVWQSVNAVQYTTLPAPNPATANQWDPTAYEIGDGQVQVSYSVSTAAVLVTSDSSTFVTSSAVTSYYTYTPLPRQFTPQSTSTSTTTVFVTEGQTSTVIESTAPTSGETTTPSRSPSQAAAPSLTTSIPDGALTSLTTSEIQTATAPVPTNTSAVVHTTLETSGNPTKQPFPSQSLDTSASLSLIDTSTLTSVGPTATANVTSLSAGNIFQPIATIAPPPQISSRSDHPVPRLNIQQQEQRLQTNKFYANFYLGDQTNPSWTHPYSVSWSAGSGQTDSFGLAVSHIESSQFSFGAATSSDAGQAAYFASPLGLQSLVLSAVELGAGTILTTDTLKAFSVNVNLVASGTTTPTITFPLIQGMAFVTGSYNSATPLIESGIGITNVTYAGAVVQNSTFKYRASLADGTTWLIYVTPENEGYQENYFTLVSSRSIQGPGGFGGYIQVAKVPTGSTDAEGVYDGSAGAYATAVSIAGSIDGTAGTYTLTWTKEGAADQPLLIFALPHHLESLANGTSGVTTVQLQTTTKGLATAIQANSWTLLEPNLPIDMSFDPWTPTAGDITALNLEVIEAINAAATVELAQNMSQQTNTGSMYYDGKALAKFAAIIYVTHELANNITLALTGLQQLEAAFALHVNNEQVFPLVYDTAWGGAVSISSYLTGNPGDDFGNTYYNDHHFHYGYFLYAAAVIGYLDPAWLTQGTNMDWVNMLARDYDNSIEDDSYFPFSRCFDWYMGHSWAEGLFPSADGKNEESSSEDTMASYGMKMWGKVINDKNMEARGNLMLSIQARSLQHYFLYTEDNSVEPAAFIGNKVSGILFENKIDHTTYFGTNIEYIEGIHMLPLMPMSTLIRTPQFVQQEWDAYNFGTYVDTLQSGWRGILMANLAIVDPVTSYNFFSNATGDFQYGMLDGGASQTWYLAWSAALGGSPYGGKVKRAEMERGGAQVGEVNGPLTLTGYRSRRGRRKHRTTADQPMSEN